MKEILVVLALLIASTAVAQTPQGTSVTYQGRLEKAGIPLDGAADLMFRLYEDDQALTQVGGDVTFLAVPVTGGLFSVDLDFGAAFDGYARWLEVSVFTEGDADWTPLPLQPVQAAPYAVYALSGPGSGTSPWNSGTYGLDYPGHVGVGTTAKPDQGLAVATGTAANNTAVFTNDNTDYATLALGNFGVEGIGFFDAVSDRHHIGGRLGVGTSTPYDRAKIDVVGSGQGLRAEVTGSILNEQVNAAVVAVGNTNGAPFFTSSMGVYAASTDDRGVWGLSTTNWGVTGENSTAGTYGVLGTQLEAVFGYSPSPTVPAARFTNGGVNGVALEANGLARVKTLQITGGADLAERFIVDGVVEAGSVVAIDERTPGALRICDRAYDTRVAGVVSGANGLDAGIILSDRESADGTVPVAMSGRVWVRADARSAPVGVGDLLTSSDLPGHARVATDPTMRSGAIIGKAMSGLEEGTGLVLVLVTLR